MTSEQLDAAKEAAAAARKAEAAFTSDLIAWEAKRDKLAFDLHRKDITKPFSDSRDAASAELASTRPTPPAVPTVQINLTSQPESQPEVPNS